VLSKHSGREHPKTDVCRVLPVMPQGRDRVVHRGWAVHERDGAECGFAGRRGIDVTPMSRASARSYITANSIQKSCGC